MRAGLTEQAAEHATVLSFEHVVKRARDGDRFVEVLDRTCLELERGATAGLFGRRRTGKSTLMRLACGLELPDAGEVRVDGESTTTISRRARVSLLREKVALIVDGAWQPLARETALEHVTTCLGGAGLSLRDARRRALTALERTQVAGCAYEYAIGLSREQLARVQLAAAIAREPKLLLVDEPMPTPNPEERERLCALLRGVAAETGTALLIASESLAALQGLQCLMSLSDGELRSTASSSATVVPLPVRGARA